MRRRAFLRGLGAGVVLTAAGSGSPRCAWSQATPAGTPFSLGIAAGDPSPDGFVIWTRIAPQPLARGGGMTKKAVEVAWAVSTDERMGQVVQSGKAIAHPELGHSVHVEVGGLQPGRDYHYQFAFGGERSAIGRGRTLPPAGAAVSRVRFAVAGCQRYEDGHFTAWRRIADERFDFVFHYGDYIYERAVVRERKGPPVVRVMPGDPDETYTLDDYRHRYALYKLDPDLQAAHASAPFFMSFDDHEVVNNWAAGTNDEGTPTAIFLMRRAAAFQAWYEHMPLRASQMPRGPDILAYRRFAVGNLLNVHVLDTRQHRSPQACGARTVADCVEALEPKRTVLGNAQERWLHDGFRATRERWTLLAQQVPLMAIDRNPDPNVYAMSMDKWDGAVAARERLFTAVEEAKLRNFVVVDGDVHRNWAGELKKNFRDEKSATVGVEFVSTSVTSLGDGFDLNDSFRATLQQMPFMKFNNNQRGYVRHTVTPERWQADFQVLDRVSVPDGRMTTRRSFVVESGRAALLDA